MRTTIERYLFGLHFKHEHQLRCLALGAEYHTNTEARTGKFLSAEGFLWPIAEFDHDGSGSIHRPELDELAVAYGTSEPVPYVVRDGKWYCPGLARWFLRPARHDPLPVATPCRTTIAESLLFNFLEELRKEDTRSRPVDYVYLAAETISVALQP